MKKGLSILVIVLLSNAIFIIYMIYLLRVEKNKPSDQEVIDYKNNMDTMLLSNIYFYKQEYIVYNHAFALYSKVKSKRIALLKPKNIGKYFQIEYYDTRYFVDTARLRNKKIYAFVNKEDLKDSTLGSKENPIIILKYFTDHSHPNYYVDEKLYTYGIQEHLTYR